MKRLGLLGSWKRLGIQAGALAGLGLAFVGGSDDSKAGGQACLGDDRPCAFKKPNFMIIMDYSASMNETFQMGQTRWEAAVEAVQNLETTHNGYFDESMHMALMRFGHDPSPNAGTTIPADVSNPQLVDGQSLDVHWYDPQGAPDYFECNAGALSTFLGAVAPPAGGNLFGIGTWTNGAMLYAQQIIVDTRADHPADTTPGDERLYANLLLTDGSWCSQDSTSCADGQNPPVADDPAPTAGDMYTNMGVPTYVVAIGNALGQPFANDIASAGGTGTAIQAGQGQLVGALETVVEDIIDTVVVPACTGVPRIMIILDASSSMLNVDGMAGMMGETGWDQARAALVGASSIFDVPIMGVGNRPAQDLAHFGLLAFGSPGEQQVLVDYGACTKPNFAWALDPDTSCGVGCNDPWGGPPITWTFVGPGDAGYPGFDQDTYSHMPSCDEVGQDPQCQGSDTYTHLGLELADDNATAYRANPPALYPIGPDTVFANILITDGSYAGYSTDGEVSNALVDMVANDDTTTYVIGFGPTAVATELANMACWGSGGTGVPCVGGSTPHVEAATQQELELALEAVIESLDFDPCCAYDDCPLFRDTTGGSDTTTSGSTSSPTSGSTTGGGGSSTTATGSADDSSGGSSLSASGPDTSVTATATASTTVGQTDGDDTGQIPVDDGCGCTLADDDRHRFGVLALLGFAATTGRRRRRRVSRSESPLGPDA